EDGIRDFHVTGVQTCALPICGASESLPRLLGPVGHHEDVGVEGCFLRPTLGARIEHSPTDDCGAGALERLTEQIVDRARIAPFADLEVLTQELLAECPCLEPGPSLYPLGVVELTGPFDRRHVPVERHRHTEEDLAHDLSSSDISAATYAARLSSVC